MFSQCANPGCDRPFNYRQGRLLRFSNILSGHRFLDDPCVKHFWLCDTCNRNYVLEYETNVGIVLRSRQSGSLAHEETPLAVCCCSEAPEHSCGKRGPRRQAGQRLVDEHRAGRRHYRATLSLGLFLVSKKALDCCSNASP